jgi:hypothetical protein
LHFAFMVTQLMACIITMAQKLSRFLRCWHASHSAVAPKTKKLSARHPIESRYYHRTNKPSSSDNRNTFEVKQFLRPHIAATQINKTVNFFLSLRYLESYRYAPD